MKHLHLTHLSRTLAPHRSAIVLISLFGACSLDTAPESSPTRASLSSLDSPSQLVETGSAAGAAAPEAKPAEDEVQNDPQPVAAVIPPAAPPAQKEEDKPVAAAEKPKAEPKPEAEPEEEPEPAAAKPVDTRGCKPGDYEGVIAGIVNLGPLEVSTLTGKINLRLVADKDNENLLRVQQGRVEGVDLNQAEFIADITGELDCATGQLVQSSVERGTYEDTTELIKIGFSGAADGQYQADPPALLGTWVITDDLLIAGQGTWTTRLVEVE